MGRFRDMWASGKNVLNKNQQDILQKASIGNSPFSQPQPSSAVTPDQGRQILAALRPRRGAETGRWLSSLAGETLGGQEQQQTAQEDTNRGDGFAQMTVWMERLFGQFAELAYEFNKTAVGTELMIAAEPPQITEKRLEGNWKTPTQKLYQGRLVTREWALMVRGTQDEIGVYIIPTTLLLGFETGSLSDQEAAPFMEICRTGNDWTIDGERAPLETAPHLAKELLGDLIRVASGRMSETELFAEHHHAPKLGETMGVGYTAPEQSSAPASTQTAETGGEGMNVFDACDFVDRSIDAELQRLYQQASQLPPGSPALDTARKQISAVETFRSKMMEAFSEFTRASHMLLVGDAQEEVASKK